MNPVSPRFGALYLVNNVTDEYGNQGNTGTKQVAAEELTKLLNGDGYYKMPEGVEEREPKPTDPRDIVAYRKLGTIGRQIRSLFRQLDRNFEPYGLAGEKPAASAYETLVATGRDAQYVEWLQSTLTSSVDRMGGTRGLDFVRDHVRPALDALMAEAEQSGRKLDITLDAENHSHAMPYIWDMQLVD